MAKVAVALAAAFMLASIAVIISIAVVQTHKKTYISRGLKVKFLNLSMPDTNHTSGIQLNRPIVYLLECVKLWDIKA